MPKTVMHAIWLVALLTAIAPAAGAFDFPQDALRWLAESSVEPCSLCAEQERKKAFTSLRGTFSPSTVVTADATCRLIKIGPEQELTLSCYPSEPWIRSLPEGARPPRLVFRFHTVADHLVGIAETDFTDQKAAAAFAAAKPGTAFEGRLQLVGYTYGTGPAFNYFQNTHTLQVHCRILHLDVALP